MTHDTPGEPQMDRRWCPNCQLSVEPEPGESGPVCPACGHDLQ
ncbi:MAG: hypothetical protein ABEI57_06145 [Halapricum sp.]